jgi:hypothetical protein
MPMPVEEGEIEELVDDEGLSNSVSSGVPAHYADCNFASVNSAINAGTDTRLNKRAADDAESDLQTASEPKRFRLFEEEEKSAKMFQHVICTPDSVEQVRERTFLYVILLLLLRLDDGYRWCLMRAPDYLRH